MLPSSVRYCNHSKNRNAENWFLNWFLDEPSEAIDDGKAVDGIDSGIGESETLDDHNDEVETEDGDSMSGTQDAKDSTNPSSLSGIDQNPSIEDPPSSTEQIGDSLKTDDDQRDQLEGEEIEVQQEVKEENSDQNLEFKPESETGNFEHIIKFMTIFCHV